MKLLLFSITNGLLKNSPAGQLGLELDGHFNPFLRGIKMVIDPSFTVDYALTAFNASQNRPVICLIRSFSLIKINNRMNRVEVTSTKNN
jgi:hypothetical protein